MKNRTGKFFGFIGLFFSVCFLFSEVHAVRVDNTIPTTVPQTGTANTFTANQTFSSATFTGRIWVGAGTTISTMSKTEFTLDPVLRMTVASNTVTNQQIWGTGSARSTMTPTALILDDGCVFTPNGGIVGVVTGSTAAAGTFGEEISTFSASAKTFTTSTQYSDIVSKSFTAGSWVLNACINVAYVSGAVTQYGSGISFTPGNSATGITFGRNFIWGVGPTATNSVGQCVSNYYVRLSATTTIYMKIRADYTVGAPTGSGYLTGVRVSR